MRQKEPCADGQIVERQLAVKSTAGEMKLKKIYADY